MNDFTFQILARNSELEFYSFEFVCFLDLTGNLNLITFQLWKEIPKGKFGHPKTSLGLKHSKVSEKYGFASNQAVGENKKVFIASAIFSNELVVLRSPFPKKFCSTLWEQYVQLDPTRSATDRAQCLARSKLNARDAKRCGIIQETL